MARLTLESFPKSGNAWSAKCLSLSFPNDEVLWGEHKISNLKEKNNVASCIRNPKDCIPSYMIFFNKTNLESVIDWYCRFYQGIISNKNKIFIYSFEQITTNPMMVMNSYSIRFNLDSPVFVNTDTIKMETKKTHSNHLPSQYSKKRILANNEVLKSPSFQNAYALYEEVSNLINKTKE